MSESIISGDLTDTEQAVNNAAEAVQEQNTNNEEPVAVSDQVEDKKQRKKRTKKSEKPGNTDIQNIEESSCDKKCKTGDSIDIRLALLYSSSAAPKHFKGIKGRYYIWSSDVVNDRVRLTDSPSGIGKPERIIGWVKVKSIL